eukprot:scaffold34712_cov66-Cyclotella_meneghiniana.AAC.2
MMLRRLRRKHEYDNVVDEHHSYENARPQISQHEVNAINIADEFIDRLQPGDVVDYSKEQPMTMQSNRVLNAVHVDVIPPSVIDSRPSSRSRARQRLDELSRRHIDEQDKHSNSSRDTPSTHKLSNSSRDTASTRSSTLSNSATVVKRDTRKSSLLANAFMGQVCNTECMTPFARHALPTISMDSESVADSSSMTDRCRESSREILVAATETTVEHGSLKQPRNADLNENHMMHAYAYNPAPPKHRTRQSEVCDVNNGNSNIKSTVTAAFGISKVGDVEMQLVQKHGYADTNKEAEAAAKKDQIVSSSKKIKSVLTRQISPSLRHDDAVQQNAAATNRKTKPSIFKAMSPILSYPQQDPSGTKQVTVSLRGSTLESNDSDKKKETPILKSNVVPSTRDKNVFRKALGQRQQRSPSPPRRTSPPLDAPADNLTNAMAVTPSPARIAQPTDKSLGQPTKPLEPPPSQLKPLSKMRRALTPKRSLSPLPRPNNGVKRFFSRRSESSPREPDDARQSNVENIEVAAKGSNQPPDPPANPLWKIGGKYSVKSRSMQQPAGGSQQTKQECEEKSQNSLDAATWEARQLAKGQVSPQEENEVKINHKSSSQRQPVAKEVDNNSHDEQPSPQQKYYQQYLKQSELQQQTTKSKKIQYQLSYPTQQQRSSRHLKAENNQTTVQNLTRPVQMKKILSSPSALSSHQTLNTTTTSNLWDGVEGSIAKSTGQTGHGVDNNASRANVSSPCRSMSFETGLHGNPKKLDNVTDEDKMIIKRLNDKNKELQQFFQVHKIEEKGQCRALKSRSPSKYLTRPSPSGEEESAFSLVLDPFSDSDISVLAMGESATVYHQRASADAKESSGDYWKAKYEELKERTQNAQSNQQHGVINEVLLEEDEASMLDSEQKRVDLNPEESPSRYAPKSRESQNDGDQSQLIQQQSLLRCGGYMGGKKAKDLAQRAEANGEDPKNKPVQSIFNRAHCFTGGAAHIVEVTPEKQNQKVIAHSASADENMEPMTDAHIVSDVKVNANQIVQLTPKRTKLDDIEPSVHVITRISSKDDDGLNVSRADVSTILGSQNTDHMPLRQIGFVERTQTLSPFLNTSDDNLDDVVDGLACYDDPMYSMDDAVALKEWNKNSRALADDLTAAGSRTITRKASSTDDSELSEGAKQIFEAALKYDTKNLFKKGVQSPPRIRHIMSTISSRPAQGASLMSEHFASSIPQDFATWFELPSPGTSCITLIPTLKGHLKNAVVVELLSTLDSSSNNIYANGVHRITAGHRVSDLLEKLYEEYVVSPLMISISSTDGEYSGPVLEDGKGGPIRFVDPSITLGAISDAALNHVKNCEFQDAINIYSALLQSCQAMSGWLVEQLIASTLHNICVLHLWDNELDMALECSRECIQKTQNGGDNKLLMHSWANMGLIHYAMEAHASAVVAFCKAIDISIGMSVEGETSQTGRLQNNLGCVIAESGGLEQAAVELQQSLRNQKYCSSSSDEAYSSANLLSTSITILNIGVTCAKQRLYQDAIKHTEAAHHMQDALLGATSELVESRHSILFFLKMLRKIIDASSQSPRNTLLKTQNNPSVESGRNDEILNNVNVNPESPDRRRVERAMNSENDQSLPSTNNHDTSYPLLFLSLGSLKIESTTVQKVRECLDKYDTTSKVSNRKDNATIARSLICRNHGVKQGISRIMSFGVKRVMKLEVQTELNNKLEQYGPSSPVVGQSYHSLGVVLLCTEDFEDSISHFDKSIRINTHALGPNSHEVASSLMFMAMAQYALEQFQDSMASLLRLRHINESKLGQQQHNEETYQIMNSIACVQYEQGDLKQAEATLQSTLTLQRETFTTDPEFLNGVSTVLFNIAFLHAKSGVFSKALIELEGALQIRQEILFDDSSTGDITENIAYILAIHQLQFGSGNIDDVSIVYHRTFCFETNSKTF